MKIATGHPCEENQVIHDFKAVRFLTDEGQPIFEVRIMDARTIEVRAIDCYGINGTVYTNQLEILPRYSNGIEIRTSEYEKD